jgi:hypothetical protein
LINRTSQIHTDPRFSAPVVPAGLSGKQISPTTDEVKFGEVLAQTPSLNDKKIKDWQDSQMPDNPEVREAFEDFVGQTFFGEMIKSLRSTQEGVAYMSGGRAEKVFQGQFDQMLSEQLSESSADQIAEPMYDLFMRKRG